MYTYKAFGLVIQSDIEINELIPHDSDSIDVHIKKGAVPSLPKNIMSCGKNKFLNSVQFFLDNNGIARYYVEKGNLIIFEPYEGSSIEEVKLYLLGSCFGAVLLQRRILPLHGSCVSIDGRGILITGKSGAGKSTIATALLNKGCKIITDDVAATSVNDNGKAFIYPSYPSQKLWEDALERSGRSGQKKTVIRISNDKNKFSMACNNFFDNNLTELTAVFEIIPSDMETVVMNEIVGFQKINILLHNTYRKVFLKSMDLKDWQFVTCVEIIKNIRVFRIFRPNNMHSEDKIADIVLKETFL